ncbi:metal-dependent hydrolase [candidate division WOR-3 bacterium]|nr:metal-dependent hydrolase [candidate division WOR-3 bacterium]
MLNIENHIARLILLIAILIIGDRIHFLSREITGIIDAFLHGIISLLILLPLCSQVYDYIIAFLAAFLIDFDHFVTARSIRIKDVINLPLRPVTHSVTFAALLCCTLWFILPLPFRNYIPIFIFISLLSHIIRDSATGITPIFWPLRIHKIPYSLYITLEIILFVVVALIKPIKMIG